METTGPQGGKAAQPGGERRKNPAIPGLDLW